MAMATIETTGGPLVVILDWECWVCAAVLAVADLGDRGLCPRCEDVVPRHLTVDSSDAELLDLT